MELHHVFGLRADVRGNVWYVDETTVLYPSGELLVLYNLETKSQRFIFGNDRSGGICSIACSPNRKHLAVGERGGTVTIYDLSSLKKRRVLATNEIQSKEIVNITFSPDNKQLITQGGAPDWTMVCWAWEKSKPLVVSKMSNVQGSSIHCTDFCPWDMSIVSVIGDGLLKFYRLQEGVAKALPFSFKREIQQYLCHAWLPEERMVVATDTGELLLFESFEFRGTLTFLRQDEDLEMAPIDCLLPYNKGFICGGAQNTLRVFESTDDPHEYFRHTKTFTVEGKMSRVINLALSPSEDNLACTLANNQIYVLGLSNTDILKAEEMSFELLTTSVHGPFQSDGASNQSVQQIFPGQRAPGAAGTGAPGLGLVEDTQAPNLNCQITGLDVCLRKPFVATAGVDRTVRVWNYLEKSVVIYKEFQEVPLSLSFHPSGLHILVGFADKLRLLNLLMDDIRPYKEFPIKGCRECKFSNGGQYFAVANGNVIQIFHTYTFECLLTLRGHAGRVHSLSWTSDDRILMSAAADGVLYRWYVKDGRKEGEFVSKGTSLNSASPIDIDANTALCTGKPDIKLKEVLLSNGEAKYEVGAPQGMGFDQIIISHSGKSVFASLYENGSSTKEKYSGANSPSATAGSSSKTGLGGSIGATIMLNLPLSSNQHKEEKADDETEEESKDGAGGDNHFHPLMMGEKNEPEGFDLQWEKLIRSCAHTGSITRLCLSHDDQFLFTCGEDGMLAIYSVTEDMESGGVGTRKTREKEPPMQFAEEILVTKSDMEEKTNMMQELKSKVEELTLYNEYQLRLKDMNYNERIKEVTDKFSAELKEDRRKYDKLKKEKVAMENMFKDRLEKLGIQHNDQVQNLERAYQEKIDTEVQRFENLVKDREQLALKWDEQNQVLVESHEKFVNEVTEDYENKLAGELRERENIEKEKQALMKQFEDRKQEVEEDADLEIEDLKEKYVAKLTVEREATLRLKGENGIMKKKFSALQNDIEDQKEKIKQLTEKEMDLYERIKGLEKDIHGHNKEIKEREETIQDKEKRIYDLKKKNQELEKFKFVLDYKIKELKRQIEPRENEIADMRQQIKEMDLELEQYQKSNAALDLMIGELKLKIEGMQKEIDEQNDLLQEGKIAADQCRLELHQAVKSLDDNTSLKQKVVLMYKKHVQGPTATAVSGSSSPTKRGTPTVAGTPAGGTATSKKAKPQKKKAGSTGESADPHAASNIQREYNRQREYLEKNVDSLKRKLNKDMKMHQADKMRLLRESVDLTNEINTLRRELHSISRKNPKREGFTGLLMSAREEVSGTSKYGDEDSHDAYETTEAAREIELQRQQIQALMQQINRMEQNLGLK